MRILVVGAGRNGAQVLRQLQKNPGLTVVTIDPRERPYAVERGIIPSVDFQESLTPLTLDYLLKNDGAGPRGPDQGARRSGCGVGAGARHAVRVIAG
jgi:UDP-N-acetylmuramoylalanine-D-glutamate ligase